MEAQNLDEGELILWGVVMEASAPVEQTSKFQSFLCGRLIDYFENLRTFSDEIVCFSKRVRRRAPFLVFLLCQTGASRTGVAASTVMYL